MTHDSRDATCGTKRWTRERPKAGGFYWLKHPDGGKEVVDVQTIEPDGEVWVALFYHDYSNEGAISADEFADCEWQGPIHPED